MMRNVLISLFLLSGCLLQAGQDPVLMRINGKEVLRSEFEYSYHRNKALSETPDSYARRFADAKLKIAAAEATGLDTVSVFRQQTEENRRRLMKSYLTDEAVTEQAARQIYEQRKSRSRTGQVRVSHIFKYLPQTISAHALREVEAQMDSIYGVLKQNPGDEVFDTFVRNFSDDKEPFWVEWLHMPVEFEQVVFQLPIGEVSQPFYTPQGIHIVKVLERKELPPFEEIKEDIIRSHTRHHRMDRGTEAKVEQLKQEYHYTPDKAGVDELLSRGHTGRTLFTLDGKAYTGKDFERFASAHPAGTRRQLDAFIVKSVLDYENNRLEQKYPDLRQEMQACRDSLLLKLITEREIGYPLSADTSGMKPYFDKHRSDYEWEQPRYKGIVVHGVTKRAVKRARKFLKSLPEGEWEDAIRLTFNAGNQQQIQYELGVFAPGDNAFVDDLVFRKADAEPLVSFPFTAVLGEKMKGPEDYREVGKKLADDYRNHLEKQWIARLRASGKVEINQEVLKTVNKH